MKILVGNSIDRELKELSFYLYMCLLSFV
uniref:Uncharacterized protein n=1 Tax=Rhizophora mucronata TaxID=61149 RepID=A0A2P2NKH0_RHIMU